MKMIRSRNKFRRGKAAGVLWFLAALAAIYVYWFVMVNFIILDFFDPPYAEKCESLRGSIAKNSGHPLWVVMGSSRVLFGFEPGVLAGRMREKDAPLIYNFAFSGMSLFRQYTVFLRLLDDGFTPRRVGIEIFAADLSRELWTTADAPSLTVRVRRAELADYLRYSNTPPDFIEGWKRSRWDPLYKFGMTMEGQTRLWHLLPLPGVSRMEKIPYDKWGWVLLAQNTTDQEYRREFAVNKRRYQDDLAHFQVLPRADLVLHKFLDLCRDRGIPAFLLKMPESEDFRALHTAEGDAKLAGYLAGIQRDYPGVQLVDASTWVERTGFTDGHHLNGAGALKFSLRFGDELFKMAGKPPAP